MVGRNLVRCLNFQDGTHWVARIQQHGTTPESTECLVCEVHTIAVVRDRSDIPVSEVYAYEANCDNAAAVPFIIMDFIPGDTEMDSFGGYRAHKSKTPPQCKAKFHAAMADSYSRTGRAHLLTLVKFLGPDVSYTLPHLLSQCDRLYIPVCTTRIETYALYMATAV